MLELKEDRNVAVLRIAHGKANALDLELCDGLTRQLDTLRLASPGALVLTGSGHIFSAGVDLVRVVEGGAAYVRAFLPALNAACEALFSFPRPVVAAINGHAIAGGCILACTADTRVMVRDGGRIGAPELTVGVPFPVAPLEILRFAVPSEYLSTFVYRGATFTADEAQAHGLVDTVVASEALMDAATAAARTLAAMPAKAFELTKEQLRAPARERMRDGVAIDRAVMEAWASPPVLQAIAAYVARVLKR